MQHALCADLLHSGRHSRCLKAQAYQEYQYRNRPTQAFKRQQRQAQVEVQQLRQEWADWDRRAGEEAEERKQCAMQRALEVDTSSSTISEGRRSSRKSSREANMQRVALQQKARTAAQRYEEREQNSSSARRYFQGASQLDPSGRLTRKVEGLAALTSELQEARLAREPVRRRRQYRDTSSDQASGEAEQLTQRQYESTALDDLGELEDSDDVKRRQTQSASQQQAGRSDDGSWGSDQPWGRTKAGARRPSNSAWNAAPHVPNDSPRGLEQTLQDPGALRLNTNRGYPKAEHDALQGQEDVSEWPEQNQMLPVASSSRLPGSEAGSLGNRNDTNWEYQQPRRRDIRQLGSSPPLPPPPSPQYDPRRRDRISGARGRQSTLARDSIDPGMPPPPPPPPPPPGGRQLTKQERRELFWAAMRGEAPAQALVATRDG